MSTLKLIIALAFCPFLTNNPPHPTIDSPPALTFDVEATKTEIFNELAGTLKGIPQNNPMLIMIGGFPGAGKTTLINALRLNHDLDLISWNAIRQALLDKKLKGSPYDWEIIEAVNRHLFKTCVQSNSNIILDLNAYSNNIKLFEDLLDAEGAKDRYTLIKICLNPPPEVLLSRVNAREQKEGVHQGNESDLIRDLNSAYKKFNFNDYSLIIKNDELIDFETEWNIVNAFLKPFF